jgi:hypothetical protein
MRRELRVGDRMRMSVRSRVEDYPPGAKGVVRGGPKDSARSGVVYYLVSMDKDDPGQTTIFNAEEIEPDE